MAPDFSPINLPSARPGDPRDEAPEDGGKDGRHQRGEEVSPDPSTSDDGDDNEEISEDDGEDGDDELTDDDEIPPQPAASRKSLKEDPLQRQKTGGRKRRRRTDNSSSASQEEMPEFPIHQKTEPDTADPAAHISVRELPHSLMYGDQTGPGRGWLGLPVGLFTKDPFEFPEDWSVSQRLPFYRVVFANFTTNVTIRWNVGSVNVYGRIPQKIEKNRVPAPSCTTSHVSFFREHAVLLNLRGKEVTVYLYSWMRSLWNMGVAMNLPNLKSCIQEDFRLEEREKRKKRMETNDYSIPLFRDNDFAKTQRNPEEVRLRIAQDMISALNALQFLPFHHYDRVETSIDEHELQELFWNFSYYVDILSTLRDQIQGDHGNTLFSTRRARAIHRRANGEAAEALDRLISAPLRDMEIPKMQLERAGGSTLFGRFPDDNKGSTVPLSIPETGEKRKSKRPGGFDDYEAYVFQKLGEFSVRGKERFGCNEVISSDPSCPQDQRSWEQTAAAIETRQSRVEIRQALEMERERVRKEMEIDPDTHPTRIGFWFAPAWDKRKAPPTPPRREYTSNSSDTTLKNLAKQIAQAVQKGTLGSSDLSGGPINPESGRGESGVNSSSQGQIGGIRQSKRKKRSKDKTAATSVGGTNEPRTPKEKRKLFPASRLPERRPAFPAGSNPGELFVPMMTGARTDLQPSHMGSTSSENEGRPRRLILRPPARVLTEEVPTPTPAARRGIRTGKTVEVVMKPTRTITEVRSPSPTDRSGIPKDLLTSPLVADQEASSLSAVSAEQGDSLQAQMDPIQDDSREKSTGVTIVDPPIIILSDETFETSPTEQPRTPEETRMTPLRERTNTPEGRREIQIASMISPKGATPKKIKRSRLLARSPEQELKRAQARVYCLDYFDLHYKLNLSNGPMSSRVEDTERQALQSEKTRRDDTMEGFGVDRAEPTPDEQKRQETDQLLAHMPTRLLRVHIEYITEGSGAYNAYQREAVAREFDSRPSAEKIPDDFTDSGEE
ncbi:unnamed protein product [Penicillium viridicatum]